MIALIGVFVAARSTSEYQRITSPDGRFYAVAEYRSYLSFVPMSPGNSSDKPGFVAIYTRDGLSCGRAFLPMLQFLSDLQWHANAAEIRLVAEWDLSQRTVHQMQ